LESLAQAPRVTVTACFSARFQVSDDRFSRWTIDSDKSSVSLVQLPMVAEGSAKHFPLFELGAVLSMTKLCDNRAKRSQSR
jgi:hypothetical protein